ncbi:hypothetical protein SCP_0202390 [Sparassis crispa]|uniref:Uncharacterized protein n=1 Tax=Sparassis crispa TaxID=139825 RepID=A0A401GA49_9APHY|nr:hypothetical protein SCP_0202390 [Sparassis crispa]GBE79042.1 hypothetical protein SCP_0202390 [Sparassis crispa]
MRLSRLNLSDDVVESLIELQAGEIARLRLELSELKSANEALNANLRDGTNIDLLERKLQKLIGLVTTQANDIQARTSNDEDLRIALKCAQVAFAEASARNDALSRELCEACTARDAMQEQLKRLEALSSNSLGESQGATLDELHCTDSSDHGEGETFAVSSRKQDVILGKCVGETFAVASTEQDGGREYVRSGGYLETCINEDEDVLHVLPLSGQKKMSSLLDKTTEQEASLEAICEERDRLQTNVADLTRDLTATCVDLAQCRSELEATKIALTAQARDVVSNMLNPTSITTDASRHEASAATMEKNIAQSMCLDISTIQANFEPFAKHIWKKKQMDRALLGFKACAISSLKPRGLLWDDFPGHPFYVRTSQRLTQDKTWKPHTDVQISQLQERGKIELVTDIAGVQYYLGTYTLGRGEILDMEDFKAMPSTPQDSLIRKSISGKQMRKDGNYQETVRQMYYSGQISAIKFPFQRVGYNTAFHDRLVQFANKL